MNEHEIFSVIIVTWLALASVVFVLLFFVTAPYGRYVRKGWGATVNNKIGWFIRGTRLPDHVGSTLYSSRIYLPSDFKREWEKDAGFCRFAGVVF